MCAWRGEEGATDRQTACAALATVDLETFVDRSLATVSGGERRRVEIAALIAQDTLICQLDESTNHMDLHYQEKILRLKATRAAPRASQNQYAP
ncbi:MAG: ATP-binding cassette domain-containing protein [Acidiferrobacterales bacterium]